MDETVEGRLIALRQALALVIAGEGREAILERLEVPVQTGAEDPGLDPGPAFAIEGAAAEERRLLAEAVRRVSGD